MRATLLAAALLSCLALATCQPDLLAAQRQLHLQQAAGDTG